MSEDKVNPKRADGAAPVKSPAMERHERRRAQKSRVTSIVILLFEILILIGVVAFGTHFFMLWKSGDVAPQGSKATQSTEKASAQSGSVNVNNDRFSLTCTKVQLLSDADGNPAALVYFTFRNKTKTPHSMSEVFPPRVTQNGKDCETFAVLENAPDELYNKDLQVSNGESIECCYAVRLYDTAAALTLTIHDNIDTFTDIGSVEIPLQ